MKFHVTHLRLSFWLTALLPLPSSADIRIPFWMDPEWIQTKLMDFHNRNTERMAQELIQAKAKAQVQSQTQTQTQTQTPVQINPNPAVINDPNARRASLAPVETALPKMNEKYLSKEELAELRKQLRQKQ